MNDILNALFSSEEEEEDEEEEEVVGEDKMGDFIEDNIRLDLATINISSNWRKPGIIK